MSDLNPNPAVVPSGQSAPNSTPFFAASASPIEPRLPPPASGPRWVFFGPDGLRAGWGLLLFLLLFALISFAASFAVAKIEHKPFGRAAQKAAQTKAAEAAKANPTAAPEELHKPTPPRAMLLAEGSGFAIVLLVTFLLARVERRHFGVYGLGGIHRIPQFLQGLLAGVVCLSLLVAMLRLGGLLRFDARLLSNFAALRFGLIWALGFTLVAFLEESLLRGYIQYTLARGLAGIFGAIFKTTTHRHAFGFWTAALLLSFVFGLGHGPNPGESPIGLLSAGLAGLVFCFALYRTGSLWWALGFHASWDWAQSFLYGVADSGTMVQGHLFATHPLGRPILSGGLTGPEGSILILPTLAIASAIILFTLPKTHHPGFGLTHPDLPDRELTAASASTYAA